MKIYYWITTCWEFNLLFRPHFRSIFIVVEIRLAWSINAHVSCVHLSHYHLSFLCFTWRHTSPVQDYISVSIENFKVSYFVFTLQSFERIEAYFLTTWHSNYRNQHSFSIVSVFVSDTERVSCDITNLCSLSVTWRSQSHLQRRFRVRFWSEIFVLSINRIWKSKLRLISFKATQNNLYYMIAFLCIKSNIFIDIFVSIWCEI